MINYLLSKISSKINSNLLFSKRLSGMDSFLPAFHLVKSGGGNIGSTAILI